MSPFEIAFNLVKFQNALCDHRLNGIYNRLSIQFTMKFSNSNLWQSIEWDVQSSVIVKFLIFLNVMLSAIDCYWWNFEKLWFFLIPFHGTCLLHIFQINAWFFKLFYKTLPWFSKRFLVLHNAYFFSFQITFFKYFLNNSIYFYNIIFQGLLA